MPLPKDAKRVGKGLPDMVKFLDQRSKNGNRILLVLGAMYDSSITADGMRHGIRTRMTRPHDDHRH